MARPQGKDRGLVRRRTAAGIPYWRVRLWHEGRDVTFQPFRYKRQAIAFYRKCKRLQRANQFYPKQFQTGTTGRRHD